MPRPLLAALLVLVSAAALHGQGALTPPGAPAPTMKSLQQISDQIGALPAAPRTPINASTGVVIISQPGNYYLLGNVHSITIQASDVTVDLNGFAVKNTSDWNGIHIGPSFGSIRNVRVHNGRVIGIGVITDGVASWDMFFSNSTGTGVLIPTNAQGVRLDDLSISGFSIGINAISSFASPYGGGRLIVQNVLVRECSTGIQADMAVMENVNVHVCAGLAVFSKYSTLRGVNVDRSGAGFTCESSTLSEITVRNVANAGANLSRCNVTGLTVSNALNGITGDFNTLARIVCAENRGHGINGSYLSIDGAFLQVNALNGINGTNNTVQNAVAHLNTGHGFFGDASTYRNVTAGANKSHGISGTGLSIDGAVVTGNTGHGVIAPESTVRGVSARGNTGAGVYADNSSITGCVARSNGDDGIRGLGSVISDCRASGNDTNAGGYVAQSIVWTGGRITNSLADTASPAIP